MDKRLGRFQWSHWLIVGVVLLALIFGGWYIFQPKGEQLDFSLSDIDDGVFHLNDFRGSVVLLDFMATWCSFCRASMPELIKLHEEFGEKVVLITISVDPSYDNEDKLRDWKNTWDVDWIHARDLADPPVSQLLSVKSVPTFVLLDMQGRIAFRHEGLTPETTLEREILTLIH